jgi:hypothetical protein
VQILQKKTKIFPKKLRLITHQQIAANFLRHSASLSIYAFFTITRGAARLEISDLMKEAANACQNTGPGAQFLYLLLRNLVANFSLSTHNHFRPSLL